MPKNAQKQEVSWVRLVVFLVAVVGIGFVFYAWQQGWLKHKTVESTVAPTQLQSLHKNEQAETPSTGLGQINPTPPDVAVKLPSMNVGCPNAFPMNWTGYPWNAQAGAVGSLGGEESMEGSLTCENNVHVKFIRKDGNDAIQQLQIDFATAVKSGGFASNPQVGTHFASLMGDGAPSYIAGINPLLKRIGPQYQLKMIGAWGKSDGEDACMVPPEIVKNPELLRGKLIVAVIGDGDWAVCVRFAQEKQICINPDEKAYDGNCVNFMQAPEKDFLKAVEAWKNHACIDLRNKATGKMENHCADGVATWTPGDKNAAKKGGLVKIASTRLYDNQMPSVIFGIDGWMKAHRKETVAFLKAGLEGGEQVKTSVRALRRAAAAEAAAYQVAGTDAAYWMKYYLGQREVDGAGLEVELGGSQAFGLSDNMATFGLGGAQGSYRDVYNTFGATLSQFFHADMPTVPKYEDVVDTSYLEELVKAAPAVKPEIKTVSFDEVTKSGEAQKAGEVPWEIEFETGKATFASKAIKTLMDLKAKQNASQTTAIQIHGYTDTTGTPEGNVALSGARALAVQTWLMSQDPVRFPSNRFNVVPHGQTDQFGSNATAEGRAKNRRVVIVTLFK